MRVALSALAALTACTGSPQSAAAPAPSLALPMRPLPEGTRELRFTASAGLGGPVPVVRVRQAPGGEVTGEMIVVIGRPVSDTGRYVREQRARYLREYGCRQWVPDAQNSRQQLCRVPFTRGEPRWSTVLGTLDSLIGHEPPSEARSDTRTQGQLDDRLPVDRIAACLDGSKWEITEWMGSEERRTAPPEPVLNCPPGTDAGKAYAAEGWRLLRAILDSARGSPGKGRPLRLHGGSVLGATLLAVAVLWPADSLPELNRCGSPKEPLGAVASRGTVAFTVTKRGTVDSASLEVLSVERGTAGGLRSALWRQLPRCRFRAARVARRDTDARVIAQVHFDLDTLRVSRLALVGDGGPAGIQVDPSLVPTDTLAVSDPRLDELPRPFDCRVEARDVVVSKVRVDGRIVEGPPQPLIPPPPGPGLTPGEVVVAYVVPTDGKVEANAIVVRRSPSNAHASAAQRRVSSCRWAPGRVAGNPVPVRIVSLERFN